MLRTTNTFQWKPAPSVDGSVHPWLIAHQPPSGWWGDVEDGDS